MTEMTHISLHIFGLIALGYGIARLGWVRSRIIDDLTALLFYVLLPLTLFYFLSKLPIQATLAWRYMGAYLLSTLIICLITCVSSYAIWHRQPSDLTLNAMATTHVNTAFLALPFFLMMYHTAAPVASIFLIQAFLNMGYLIALELTSQQQPQRLDCLMIGKILYKNPIIVGALLGVLFSEIGLSLPTCIDHGLHALSHLNAWVALITLGLSLGVETTHFTAKEKHEITALIATKTALHPLVAYGVGRCLHLTGFSLTALVLMAAMPTAKVVFVYARRYHVGPERANFIVVITTALALLSLNGIAWWMQGV